MSDVKRSRVHRKKSVTWEANDGEADVPDKPSTRRTHAHHQDDEADDEATLTENTKDVIRMNSGLQTIDYRPEGSRGFTINEMDNGFEIIPVKKEEEVTPAASDPQPELTAPKVDPFEFLDTTSVASDIVDVDDLPDDCERHQYIIPKNLTIIINPQDFGPAKRVVMAHAQTQTDGPDNKEDMEEGEVREKKLERKKKRKAKGKDRFTGPFNIYIPELKAHVSVVPF